jgi:hypothetical protein
MAHATEIQEKAADPLTALVYELLDAHSDTVYLADLLEDDRWVAHLDYLRDLQRVGREHLAASPPHPRPGSDCRCQPASRARALAWPNGSAVRQLVGGRPPDAIELPSALCPLHADRARSGPCAACMRAQQHRLRAHSAASLAAAREWRAAHAAPSGRAAA